MSEPELPGDDGLLLFMRVIRSGRPWERRVFTDGRGEERTDVSVDFDETGAFSQTSKPWVWEHLGTLSADALGTLRSAMAGAFTAENIGEHAPTGTVTGGAEILWVSYAAEPPAFIWLKGHPATAIPAVTELRQQLDDLLGEAADPD